MEKNKYLEARQEGAETERLLAKADQDFFSIIQGSVFEK
jgi:hypothetical protein